MNTQLKESGLAATYKISSLTGNLELSKYLGKKVQYKRDLLNDDFLKKNGTLSLTAIFEIKETQLNHKGVECLRGYDMTRGDTFGRCINISEIELI
jgi:hypothetical protein